MQSAELAARAVAADGIDVRVVDSRTVSLGPRHDRPRLRRARPPPAPTLDEVDALAADLVDRTRVFGALDTLDNLKKGGRIGNAKALLATALAIKPIIEVADGVVEQDGKQRTRSKALALPRRQGRATYEGRIEHLAVLHADCSDVDEFVDQLRPLLPTARSSSARSARSSAPTPAAARSASPSTSAAPDAIAARRAASPATSPAERSRN